jgi:hypothetical protein
MTYSLIIEHNYSDPTYVNDIKTWEEVLDYHRNKLDQWVVRVHIFKLSSNNRLLGDKVVSMDNLYAVASSKNDKVLL